MEPVDFGSRRGLRICNERRRKLVLHTLSQLCRWQTPVLAGDLEAVARSPSVARPVMVEGRSFIILLATIDKRRLCCFIEVRTGDIFQTRIRLSADLFAGTVITGSLAPTVSQVPTIKRNIAAIFDEVLPGIHRRSHPTRPQSMFVSTDILCLRGSPITSTLPERLQILQGLFDSDWFPDPRLDVCTFIVSPFLGINQIEDWLRNRHNFPCKASDRLVVFVPLTQMDKISHDPLPSVLLDLTESPPHSQQDHQDH